MHLHPLSRFTSSKFAYFLCCFFLFLGVRDDLFSCRLYGWGAFRVNTPSTVRDFWTPRYSGQLWPTENLEVALLDHLEEKIPCDVDVDDNEETLMPQMLQKDSRPIQSRANLTHQLIVMSKLGSNINFNDRLCAMRYSSGEQCKMVIKSLRR